MFEKWNLRGLKTLERRIGIVGTSYSGKTVFLTSLINHLAYHDPLRFRLAEGIDTPSIRRFTRLTPDRGWAEFPYEHHRERLVSRRWPAKTADMSQYVCQIERSDWRLHDGIVKLYDLPGERINDVSMLGKSVSSHADWSDTWMRRIEAETAYADRFAPFFADALQTTKHVGEVLYSYRRALAVLRSEYKPYLTPSTFLLDREGKQARGTDIEALANERYVGMEPASQFCPLPANVRAVRPDLAALFESRFQLYRRHVVAPWVLAVKQCHALIVLVDVPLLLAGGTGAHDDVHALIADLLRALNPSENLLEGVGRVLSNWLLPHDWRPSWIHKLAFVAPKADLVHPDDRGRLRHLLHSMIDREAGNHCSGIQRKSFAVAAVRSTEGLPNVEGKRFLAGSAMRDAENRSVEPGERVRFAVSEVPTEWPAHWNVGDYVFPSVYPEFPVRKSLAPEQVGLDEVFRFVC